MLVLQTLRKTDFELKTGIRYQKLTHFITEIYHVSYYILQDNLKLFMIHMWRIREFRDFLIFERHLRRVGVAFNYGDDDN
jgi:hypothetical protein